MIKWIGGAVIATVITSNQIFAEQLTCEGVRCDVAKKDSFGEVKTFKVKEEISSTTDDLKRIKIQARLDQIDNCKKIENAIERDNCIAPITIAQVNDDDVGKMIIEKCKKIIKKTKIKDAGTTTTHNLIEYDMKCVNDAQELLLRNASFEDLYKFMSNDNNKKYSETIYVKKFGDCILENDTQIVCGRKKFHSEEDMRIQQLEPEIPGAGM